MTIAELAHALEERCLTLKIWQPPRDAPAWTVWLYVTDDPELGIIGRTEGDLETAIIAAIATWDGEVKAASTN